MTRSMVIGIAALLCSACASATLDVRIPLAEPIDRVAISVTPVRDAAWAMNRREQSLLMTSLTSALSRAGVTVVSSSETDVPLLQGQIELYDEGSRARRWLFPLFGLGAGHLESTWVVRRPDGALVGGCRVDGSIRAGIFGGSFDVVVEEAGARLAEFLLERP